MVNAPDDLGCLRRLHHLDELQSRARAVNAPLLDAERVGQGCVLANPAFERIAHPTLTADGGEPRPCVSATLGSRPWPAPCVSVVAVTGITNRSLRALMTGLLGATYSMNQASYDLARLRLNGLIIRIPRRNTYGLTGDGLASRSSTPNCTTACCVPLLAADQPQAPPELRAALHTVDQHIDQRFATARLPIAA